MTFAEQYSEIIKETKEYTEEELRLSGIQKALDELEEQIFILTGEIPKLESEEYDIYY